MSGRSPYTREAFDILLGHYTEADAECAALLRQGISFRSDAWKEALARRDAIADEMWRVATWSMQTRA